MTVQKWPHGRRPVGPGTTRATRSSRPAGLEGWTHPSVTDTAEIDVRVSRGRSRATMTVSGALDMRGAALVSAMLDHVEESAGRSADVDLTGVTYADSHGLAPLLDGQVTIQRASPVVRRLLSALGRSLPRTVSTGPATAAPWRRPA